MREVLEAQSAVLGTVERMIADTGFCSEKNILACEEAHLEPLIAVARDVHHPGWRERHSEPALLRDNATPMQSMAHRLESKAGRALYALRKQTVEPVFGIIKALMNNVPTWTEAGLASTTHLATTVAATACDRGQTPISARILVAPLSDRGMHVLLTEIHESIYSFLEPWRGYGARSFESGDRGSCQP